MRGKDMSETIFRVEKNAENPYVMIDKKTHSWGVGRINTGVLTMRNIAQKKGVMQ